LRRAANVELPGRQARGEPYVLALLADRERELVVGDDDLHALVVLVHDDLRDLGRRERAADELGLIAGPRHDVDLFAAQLLDDGLHARALHADARADGIDVVVVGSDGDLGPASGSRATALISTMPS